MISPAYAVMMARYNRWQNGSLYGAAGTLTDTDRNRDRGAFFGSIHATLSHLLWADQQWMSRFAGTPPPAVAGAQASKTMVPEWAELKRQREAFDQIILQWAKGLDQARLDGDLTWWSGGLKREMVEPMGAMVVHFFNHQTHHRGQVHAMLTAAGATPDATDIMVMSTRTDLD